MTLSYHESLVPYNAEFIGCCLSTVAGQSFTWHSFPVLIKNAGTNKEHLTYPDLRLPAPMIMVIDVKSRIIRETILFGKGVKLKASTILLLADNAVIYDKLTVNKLSEYLDKATSNFGNNRLGTLEQEIISKAPYMREVFNEIKTSMSVATVQAFQ